MTTTKRGTRFGLMNSMSSRKSSGFTLVELMIVVAIMGVILAAATPAMVEIMKNNRVQAQNLNLMSMLNFAKNESIRRNTDVQMVFTPGTQGWSMIIEDPEEAADIDGCQTGQLRCSSNTDVGLKRIDADGTSFETTGFTLTFNNRGYLDDADTTTFTPEILYLQHKNCKGNSQRRRIDIKPTGQVSSCILACDSTAACP